MFKNMFFVMSVRFTNYAELICPFSQPHTKKVCYKCGGICTTRINPIIQTHFIGKKEADYFYDSSFITHLVSPSLLQTLHDSDITGFYDQETHFIDWTDRTTGKKLDIDGSKYREIVITGRGGFLTDLEGNRIPHCEECGKIEYFGLYAYKGFSTDAWDGSDMFFLENWPGVLLVTEKVKEIITKNKFKNVRFVPLSEFQFA